MDPLQNVMDPRILGAQPKVKSNLAKQYLKVFSQNGLVTYPCNNKEYWGTARKKEVNRGKVYHLGFFHFKHVFLC